MDHWGQIERPAHGKVPGLLRVARNDEWRRQGRGDGWHAALAGVAWACRGVVTACRAARDRPLPALAMPPWTTGASAASRTEDGIQAVGVKQAVGQGFQPFGWGLLKLLLDPGRQGAKTELQEAAQDEGFALRKTFLSQLLC